MKKIVAFVLMTSFLSAFAQTTFIEEVTSNGENNLVISYKKYKLANGLTVILHEDHSDPIVHVDMTYHVGSAREVYGRSGFAHFFEHMMFQGSEHVRDEEHFRIVSENGGTLNGTTNLDRTNYFETLPSNKLETALWLEADRMGWFLDSVTIQKFEIQRATVKNERGQNYDNKPYGLANEKTIEVLYPFNHPYSWSTIGYIEDLNAATLDDLKRFFMRWYGPNNATLTVAGDIDPTTTLALIEKYYNPIPAGPEVKNMPANVPTLDKTKYISYEDNIRFPMLKITYPTVPARHPDEAPLDVLSQIIGGNVNSILYQNLVKSQKAVQARTSSPTFELSGVFDITILPFPGTTLAEMEKAFNDALVEFETKGVKQEDIDNFYMENYVSEMKNLQTVSGKASKLAYYQTFTGNANYINQDISRYKNVKVEDVMRVYQTYIKGKNRVVLSIYPKGKKDVIAAPDNDGRPTMPANFKPDLSEYTSLTYKEGIYPFSVDYRPPSGKSPVVSVPKYWTQDLGNGVKIIGTDYTELPLAAFTISIKAGHVFDPLDKSGLSSITSKMLKEATENYTSETLNKKLESLGSSISTYSDLENIYIEVTCLKSNLDATIELAKEVLLKPKFNQDDFDRIKKQTLESIANQKNQAEVVANNVLNKVLYGNDILSTPTIGTDVSVNNISLQDVKDFYNQYVTSNTKLVFVGNNSKSEVVKKFEFLNQLTVGKIAMPTFKNALSQTATTIYFVDKVDAPQSQIRVAQPGLPFDATGMYYKANFVNFALGGAFNSRLNLNLREKRGYTYGVRGSFSGSKLTGIYSVSGGFIAKSTDTTVTEIIKEITNYKDNGLSIDEFIFTQNSYSQRDALKYESVLQKAGFISLLLDYGLKGDYPKKQLKLQKKTTKFQMDQLAKTLYQPDKLTIIIVGDKKKVFDNLKKLGYPIVELDFQGNPIK